MLAGSMVAPIIPNTKLFLGPDRAAVARSRWGGSGQRRRHWMKAVTI